MTFLQAILDLLVYLVEIVGVILAVLWGAAIVAGLVTFVIWFRTKVLND